MKNVLAIYSAPRPHWVGDGFPVRSLFAYDTHGKQLDPFLLLDYAGPAEFAPATTPRGVGQHPHRGFETVTIVHKGEVAHRDSTGKGGIIGPGAVQWMTAAAGILHEEFHSPAFTKTGGELEMVQLWVNLPARAKMSAPGYQAIDAKEIPVVALPNAAGTARIIAGELQGQGGPARTFTPMHVWDLNLAQGSFSAFATPRGWTTALVVLQGSVRVNGESPAHAAQVVVLDRNGENFSIAADAPARVLLLSGAPIGEPIVGYGPFVMNSHREIEQAITDFNAGRFGAMPT